MENSYSHNPEGLNGLQAPWGIPIYEHPALPAVEADGKQIHVQAERNDQGIRKLYASKDFMDMLKNYALNVYEEAKMYRCMEMQVARPKPAPLWKRLTRALFGEDRVWPQPQELYLPTGLPALKGAQIGDYLVLRGNTYRIMDLVPMDPVVVASGRAEKSDNLFKDPL